MNWIVFFPGGKSTDGALVIAGAIVVVALLVATIVNFMRIFSG